MWLNEAFKTTSTVDSLHEIPKTLLSIDGKLATALQQMLNTAGVKGKTLLHRIQMKMQEELERHSRLLGGRQTLHMVTKAFVTSDNTETYLGVEHLANLHMNSNNDLEKFWNQWEQIVSQLPPMTILPKDLESMLYNKVHKHTELAQPIKEYERADPTSILRTYERLSTEVRHTVNLDQMRKNLRERDDRMKELSQGKVRRQQSKKKIRTKDRRVIGA